MKSDIKLIDLNNLDINALQLPKEKYSCYIICNNIVSNKELLKKIIEGEVKDINAHGKFSSIWEKDADDICIEYENNDLKPDGWCVTTASTKLDSFIFDLAFEHSEYFDDEALSHDPIILFYDDENLKNIVMKKVEQTLEDTSNKNK